jgi:hypothetical protein
MIRNPRALGSMKNRSDKTGPKLEHCGALANGSRYSTARLNDRALLGTRLRKSRAP